MEKALFALAPVGIILVLSEYLWRKQYVKGERARKFIHILAGAWMAFWPFYLSFESIYILGCAAFCILLYSRITKLFNAIYAVKRRTYGELFFAIAIILCALITDQPWVFTTSILLLALADGGAAVVGRFWGIDNQYFVFGWPQLRKSVAGTAAYVGLAYFCIVIGWLIGGEEYINNNLFAALVVLPVGATLLENLSPYGLDNIFTPVFASLLLGSLA